MHRLFYSAAGALVAVAFVFSCSDDSPGGADAATANCEPSLAGRIVTVEDAETGTNTIAAIAICPAGAIRLGGGCELAGDQEITLRQAGARSDLPGNYACEWRNPNNSEATGTAWVTCLVPAP